MIAKLKNAGSSSLKTFKDTAFVTKGVLRLFRQNCGGLLFGLAFAVVIGIAMNYLRWQAFGAWIQALSVGSGAKTEAALFVAALGVFALTNMCIDRLTILIDKNINQYYTAFFPSIRLKLGMTSFQGGSKNEELLSRAEEGEFHLRFFIPQLVGVINVSMNLLIGGMIILYHLPSVGLILGFALMLVFAIEIYTSVKISVTEKELWGDLAETTTTKYLFKYKENLKAVLLFGMGNALLAHLRWLAKAFYQPQIDVIRKMLPLQIFSVVILTGLFAYAFNALMQAHADGLAIGTVSFLAVTITTIVAGLKQLVDGFSKQIQGADKVADVLRYLENSSNEGMASASGMTSGLPLDPPEIVIEKLSFSYDPKKPIYSDFSVTIPGHCVNFVVGGNGVGKSTLFSLIDKLFEVEPGMIRVGGIDICDVDANYLREYIRQLPQGTLTLRYTLREMFRFVAGKEPEEGLIWTALKMATLDNIAKSWEQGLDQPLASHRGGGKNDLSGGQHKKLNIALFFYSVLSGQTRVAILDEPFIGIDPESALKIMKAFFELPCTILISMHEVERIPPDGNVTFLCKQDGKVQAFQGKHEDLLAENEAYAKYCGKTVEKSAVPA